MAEGILQCGLTLGMSATEGIHSPHPRPVDPTHSEEAYVLSEQIIPDTHSKLKLRGSSEDILVPYMCIGAWAWGDRATWHYTPDELPRIRDAWEVLRNAGLNWIDTAQAYGSGESERICGDLFQGLKRSDFVVQTKWFPLPDTTNVVLRWHAIVKKLRASLERLRLKHVDAYLVHGPVHSSSISTVAKGLAECVRLGLTRTVGVSNYDAREMTKMADALAKHDVPLAVNQCEYSILRRHPESHGLIRTCRERGIVFQSYAPLAEGRLTGKYSQGNEPPRTYRFSNYSIHDIEPVIAVLRRIAEARRVTIPAVALNYNLNKGAIPVVGVRNAEQVHQNIQALGWRLSQDEIRRIEGVSFEGRTSFLWQHG